MQKSVGFEIRAITNQLKRHINSLPVFQQYDLRGGRGYILGFLYDHSGKSIYQKDIEEEMALRKSSVTSLLNNLEKNGLIERRPSSEDARLKSVVLTDKGSKIHEEVASEIDRVEELLTEGFSAEETATFMSLLARIERNIENI